MPFHLHSGATALRLQQRMVQASIPAACVLAWHQGFLLLANFPAGNLPGWPDWLLADYLSGLTKIQPESPLTCFFIGAIYLTPRILGVWLVAWSWSALFARLRQRATDPIWFMTGWLLALLAPVQTGFGVLAIACSFGVVFGALLFGGSGRSIVSPALLAAVFLQLAYPPQANPSLVSSTELAYAIATPVLWITACALGALWLVHNRTISARTLTGCVTAALLTGLTLAMTGAGDFDSMPWYSHLALGNSAFVVAFVLTDPGCAPHTHSGRWALGIAFGVLLVILRTLDPAQPEGSNIAALLAMLFIPLVDHLHTNRVRKQLAMP